MICIDIHDIYLSYHDIIDISADAVLIEVAVGSELFEYVNRNRCSLNGFISEECIHVFSGSCIIFGVCNAVTVDVRNGLLAVKNVLIVRCELFLKNVLIEPEALSVPTRNNYLSVFSTEC